MRLQIEIVLFQTKSAALSIVLFSPPTLFLAEPVSEADHATYSGVGMVPVWGRLLPGWFAFLSACNTHTAS